MIVTSHTHLRRHVQSAMGVAVEVLAETPTPVDFSVVVDELERLEQMFSRFRPDSELSRLNASGRAVVSDELYEVVDLALGARTWTGGRFDPTVHDALVAAGYDRTFATLPPAGAALPARPCGGAVELDPATRTVLLDGGVRLDLGGIAKGWTAEHLASILAADGPCLVNLGGDIAVRGVPADGVWPVAIEAASSTVTLGVGAGGLATSGRDRRCWSRGGREQHHLIDPATGRPADTDVLRLTVLAADAVEAEIEAKSLFLLGASHAAADADRRGLPCLIVTRDGRDVYAGGLA